jgi:hypothetical protein
LQQEKPNDRKKLYEANHLYMMKLALINPSLTITYKDLSQISQACENLRGYRPSQVAPDLRWRGGRVEFRKCVRPQI